MQVKSLSRLFIRVAAITLAAMLQMGCGTMGMGTPSQTYALQCAWCNRTVASGIYTEYSSGNVDRQLWRRETVLGWEGQSLPVGSTRTESLQSII